MDELIAEISKAFAVSLPGWEAQSKMMNYKRPRPENIESIDPDARQGAVLALLYPKNNEIFTVLMLRNVYTGTHSGQVSFPGGKKEVTDDSLWHTALREASEEVGINQSEVHQLGQLTKIYIPPSRFLVSPYLAWTSATPQFVPDPIEVQKIIETPVSLFLDPKFQGEKNIFVNAVNAEMKVRYFDVAGETVWGATAMILSELSEILKPLYHRLRF